MRLSAALACLSLVVGAVRAGEPLVTLEPFEPTYKAGDKFARPREIVAPRFLWPFEMRRGAMSGEVVVLVELDGTGKPRRVAPLYSTHPLFTRSAVEGLSKAKWDSTSKEWFYYKVAFDPAQPEPNQSPEPTSFTAPKS